MPGSRKGPFVVAAIAVASFAAIVAVARAGSPRPPARIAGATIISSRHTKVGVILVGPRGQTLYLFSPSPSHTGGCYGRCARNWPPLLAAGRPVATPGSGVKQQWLGTTRRRNGSLQVTYHHAPLYVNAGHTNPGSLIGDHAHEFGGRWYAVPVAGVAGTCVGHC